MITSSANPTIKAIRKLVDRKERRQSGLFYVEGLRNIGEAIQKQWEIETLIVAPELLVSLFGRQLVEQAAAANIPVLEVSESVFRQLSEKEGPQGMGAVGRQRWTPLEEVVPQTEDTWIALDSVQDPGNLGTILRTSDAAGCVGVMLLDHSTDPYDPGAVRASMGAIFSQQLVKTTFADFAHWKRLLTVPVIGTSDKAQMDYHSYRYPQSRVVLMGSERQGLTEQHTALCDAIVSIPMMGSSDSLNLAVATGLIIYEILNQRRDRLHQVDNGRTGDRT